MVEHIDAAVRAAVVARLRDQRGRGGPMRAEVRRSAAGLGVADSTVWRWLSAGEDNQPTVRGYRLTEADRDDFWRWRGNVAALWRERVERNESAPGLRVLQRAFAGQLTPAERAAVVDGVEGRRRHQVYLRWESPGRNARWDGDHTQLSVLVTPPHGVRPVRPWATLFLDCYSRLVMGWALSLCPDGATVLAALRQGLVVDADRVPFGGIPDVLVPDNGLEFASDALRRVCVTLGISLEATDAYAPEQKGKLERANRTLDQEFLCGLPFYTGGPRAVTGRLFGPDAPPMGLSLFTELFAEWVTEYNTARPHSALAGQTPLARWQADATPIRQVAEEQLRWLLLADVSRTVNKDGIHFGGVTFIAGALNGLVGRRLQVRYAPHDLRKIEVFDGDRWLCTALPQGRLSDAERAGVLAQRRTDAAELGRRQRRASRRARARLAPITGPGEVTDATVVTAAQARRERHGYGDAELRKLAMTNLLGLNTDVDYWNPGPADGRADHPDAAPTDPQRPGSDG